MTEASARRITAERTGSIFTLQHQGNDQTFKEGDARNVSALLEQLRPQRANPI